MQEVNVHMVNAVQKAVYLGHFNEFCEKFASKVAQRRMRTIYSRAVDPIETTQIIYANEFSITISELEAKLLFRYITAFLHKSAYRKIISSIEKDSLLQKQDYHCAICGCDIDMHAHADHIVPFKFVGDELENNLQMLCGGCNHKKNASLDYQVRFLLNLL